MEWTGKSLVKFWGFRELIYQIMSHSFADHGHIDLITTEVVRGQGVLQVLFAVFR